MALPVTQTKIKLPKGLTRADRVDLTEQVIEYVKQRTEAGKDWRGKPFPKYSETYKDSLDFKIAGKTNKVNLTLSGDMIASIELLRHSDGEAVIGFKRGSEEESRAEGNILGTYGQDTPIKGKARPFLGITETDLKKVIRKWESQSA